MRDQMLLGRGPGERLKFDTMIGTLDRCLSYFLIIADYPIDEVSKQTLKHHAEDMIGAGQKILEKLNAE